VYLSSSGDCLKGNYYVFEKMGVVLIGEEECYFNKTMKRYNRLLSENNDGGGMWNLYESS
jgi:hypothetical protein